MKIGNAPLSRNRNTGKIKYFTQVWCFISQKSFTAVAALFYHNFSRIILLFSYTGFTKCHVGECNIVECVLWYSSLVTLCTNPNISLWLPINVYPILSEWPQTKLKHQTVKITLYTLHTCSRGPNFGSKSSRCSPRLKPLLKTLIVTTLQLPVLYSLPSEVSHNN